MASFKLKKRAESNGTNFLPVFWLASPFSGSLPQASNFEVIETIKRCGGRVVTRIDGSVNVVLSCEDVAFIIENPYKLQFSPELKTQIEDAQTYNVPVVESSFIAECVKAGRYMSSLEDFVIPQFVEDIEAKYRIKNDVPSSLDPRVQELVANLFDQQTMDDSLVDLGLDVRKMKLIDQGSITSAFETLKQIEASLSPEPGQSAAAHETKLNNLSQSFYQRIPHKDVLPPTIKTSEAIKQKSAMLMTLIDIEIAQRLLRESNAAIGSTAQTQELNMNPLDVKYRKLRTKIVPLESYQQEYSVIQKMVENTQSKDFQFSSVSLEGVYEIEREGEVQRFEPFSKMPHHRLLWHGSRTTNYIGILSQGLRIAPAEAPVTGYFLGKGIYFGNMVAVSAQYCRATREKPFSYLLLADVALGRSYQLAHGKFISQDDLDDAGFHSVKCAGTKTPDPAYDLIFADGMIASLGKESRSPVPVSELVHDEIVIYDPCQANIKYMLKVKFEFPPQ